MTSRIERVSPEIVAGEPRAAGERVLWQGRPGPKAVFWNIFRARWVALYLVVLAVWRISGALTAPDSSAALGGAIASVAVLAGVIFGLLWLFAVLTARASEFTVTNERVIMKIGIALPMTINVPLDLIQRADLRTRRDGGGDIVLTLVPQHRVSYIVLWPYVLPFHFLHVRPSLRCLDDVDAAAKALAKASGQSATEPAANAGETIPTGTAGAAC